MGEAQLNMSVMSSNTIKGRLLLFPWERNFMLAILLSTGWFQEWIRE